MSLTWSYAIFTSTSQNDGSDPTQSLKSGVAMPKFFLESSSQTSITEMASNVRIILILKMNYNKLMTSQVALIETIFQSFNLLPIVHQ